MGRCRCFCLHGSSISKNRATSKCSDYTSSKSFYQNSGGCLRMFGYLCTYHKVMVLKWSRSLSMIYGCPQGHICFSKDSLYICSKLIVVLSLVFR